MPSIQLRVGDITLLGGDAGANFFRNLKSQLDIVLDHFPVHYYFFAEEPQAGTNPPASFFFLQDIFGSSSDNSSAEPRQRVSYINNLDVKGSIHHQMNADMLITTGSSFALVAATISPKVSHIVVTLGHGPFPMFLNGSISSHHAANCPVQQA